MKNHMGKLNYSPTPEFHDWYNENYQRGLRDFSAASKCAAAWNAALVARATPAQPVPSPSSVGDAIRALPLPYVKVPPNGAQTQWGRDMANCGAEVMCENIIALLPRLLSEAAALAEQAQGQQWISIQDRYPDPMPGRQFSEAVLVINMNSGWPNVTISEANFYESEIVWRGGNYTHWMPLPAAPSIAQDGQKSEDA